MKTEQMARVVHEVNRTAPAVGIRLDRTVRLTVTELHQLLDYAQHCENEGWYWGNKAQFRKRHDKLKAWLNAQIDVKTSRAVAFSPARRPQDDEAFDGMDQDA